MDQPLRANTLSPSAAAVPPAYVRHILALCLGIALFTGPHARADGGSGADAGNNRSSDRIVRLADLMDHAYAHNPSIQQARDDWRATVENYRLKTGYPDPQLMVTWFPEPIETRLGPQDWNAQISQKIPFPGKLSTAGELVVADARIARLRLDQTTKDTLLSLTTSYYELWYIRQARSITRHNARLLAQIRKIGETAHAEGRATLTDVVKAQSQTGQLQYDALLLEELEQTEIARLNGLLNRSPDSAIGSLAPPSLSPLAVDVERIDELARASLEGILMAQAGVDKSDTKISLARFQNLPDFKIGLFYAGIGRPDVATPPKEAGRDAVGIQAGVSIPLWFGKNRSRVDKAMAEKSKARAKKQALVNDVRTRVRALFFKTRNAERLVTLYQENLVPEAARAMTLAEAWYREGEGSFTDFIETQSVWYNFQLAQARATADYGIALARLERLAGRPLTGHRPPLTTPAEREPS
jgi:outer membrane protein, heavy metal efflux system